MKVLNLQCSQQHAFEGWFASEDDFQGQLARGLVECPFCADSAVRKMPSAPRLNLRAPVAMGATDDAAQEAAHGSTATPAVAGTAPATGAHAGADAGQVSPEAQAAFLAALQRVVAQTEDVGKRFAEEARRMHYGEEEPRNIRGQASAREAVELLEEGIGILPIPAAAATEVLH